MANFNLLLLFLALVSLSHANARNIPTDPDHLTTTHDQALTNPNPNPSNNTNALAPVQEGTETIDTSVANTPSSSANGVEDEKNFIAYGGLGGWGGVGGWVGVLPIFGGLGGLGKVGGVGAGGGVGGVGGLVGGLP